MIIQARKKKGKDGTEMHQRGKERAKTEEKQKEAAEVGRNDEW